MVSVRCQDRIEWGILVTQDRFRLLRLGILLGLVLSLGAAASAQSPLKETMDGIVTRFYATLDRDALKSLSQQRVLQLITDQEREILASKYWTFEVNVPVVVSLMRSVKQSEIPFWIKEAGFEKTVDIVKSDLRTFEVWQKSFDAGRVELGISGFERHLDVYFLCVAPQQPDRPLEITNIDPPSTTVQEMKPGAWYLRDWQDLHIAKVPERLVGQKLLTTCRGRAWESHLVGGFREAPFPSSSKPDHVILTWSEDPRTTQTIQWRTNTDVKKAVVRYREAGSEGQPEREVAASSALIEDRLLMNDRYSYRYTAVLRGLRPATTYTYRVGCPENQCWTERTTFTTGPERQTPFSFVFLGDIHCWHNKGQLLRTIEARHPDVAFYVIAGDLTHVGLFRNDWDLVFEYAKGIFDRKPVAWALGNHDEPNGLGGWLPLALAEFPHNGPKGVPPEYNYSFRYGNTLFLMLDVDTSPEIQAEWMEQQLADSDARHRIGVYHFPLYAVGDDDDEYDPIRLRWETVFAKHHLDMMLHGHVHYYLRTAPMKNGHIARSLGEGTVYVTSLGTAGRKIDREIPVPDYVRRVTTGGPWYQKIDVQGDRILYRAYEENGELIDEMVLE